MDNPTASHNWTVDEVNKELPERLIDNLDLLDGEEGDPELKQRILGSERLRSLMNQDQETSTNEIAVLPDEEAVSRHFYCACCKKIPFPWVKDPNPELSDMPEGVYVCDAGHAICRTCARMFPRCVFSMKDYITVYGDNDPSDEAIERHTKPITESVAGWRTIRICSEPITGHVCGFLDEMISTTKFACKNYYNDCDFEGQGKNLVAHEANCPYKETAGSTAESETESETDTETKIKKSSKLEEQAESEDSEGDSVEYFGDYDDDDEAAILSFDWEQAFEEIESKIKYEIGIESEGSDGDGATESSSSFEEMSE